MRTGGGADESGVQTAYSFPFFCGGTEPHGSRADSERTPVKRGAGDRSDRPASECLHGPPTARVVHASTDSCGPRFECPTPHWLIRKDGSYGTHARPCVRSSGSADSCSAGCSGGTCACSAGDYSPEFRTSVRVWHAGFRVQDDGTAWTQRQTRCCHGAAA